MFAHLSVVNWIQLTLIDNPMSIKLSREVWWSIVDLPVPGSNLGPEPLHQGRSEGRQIAL